MKKISLIILLFSLLSFGQKKYFKEALSKGRNSSELYYSYIDEGKVVKQSDVEEYAQENNIILRNITTQEVNRFGDKFTGVKSFSFLPISEISKYVFSRFVGKNFTDLSFDSFINGKKANAYIYNPKNLNFENQDVYWSGNYINGNANGEGFGLYLSNDNKEMLLFKATFNNGKLEGYSNFKQYTYFNNSDFENGKIQNESFSISKFNEGYASFKYKDFYGFINEEFNIILQPIYQNVISNFNDNKAIVKKDNQEIIIDNKGIFIDYSQNQKNIFEEKRKQEEERRLAELERIRIQTENAKINITNEFNSLKNSNDEYALYNFYSKYHNSQYDFAKDYASITLNWAKVINSKNIKPFNDALNYNQGNTLVKIVIKKLNNQVAFPYVNQINSFLNDKYSYSFALLGGYSRDEKLFYNVDAVACLDKIVINASWYRAGTEKDGSIWVENSGFPKFKSDFANYMNQLGFQIEYLEYLGSYDDDVARAQARQRAYEEYKVEQCLKCTVDIKKTEVPRETSLWGTGILTSMTSGRIVMKNGESYTWDYSKEGYKVPTGIFSSDEYETFDEMINALISKCMDKKCN